MMIWGRFRKEGLLEAKEPPLCRQTVDDRNLASPNIYDILLILP